MIIMMTIILMIIMFIIMIKVSRRTNFPWSYNSLRIRTRGMALMFYD